jgi:3-oxoacyl-[acyl-carrier protein] reductase
MDLGLENKVAFIAGSSRGIGLAIARGFLAEGARVVITGRDGEALAASKHDLGADDTRLLAVTADLSQPAGIDTALAQTRDRFGPIDALVANIGSGSGQPGWNTDAAEWLRLLEVNLLTSIRLATAALPAMTKRKSGALVFISSIAGLEASPAPLAYSSAKAALLSYVNNLSRELADANIRVNAVAPGNILFPGGSWERHLKTRQDEVRRYIESEVPMKRFGTPEEIADAVVFLCSARATFITGACLVADGGQARSL